MDTTITLENARRAKRQASDDFAFQEGVVGIGLTELGAEYAIKINVETTADVAAIPSHICGVPVVIDVVGTISALTKP